MLVRRATSLGDHALPSLGTGAVPRLFVLEWRDTHERGSQRQSLQQRLALLQRQWGNVSPIDPQNVEDVIHVARLSAPRHLAIENEIPGWQRRDGVRDLRIVLRQLVARQQSYGSAVLERDQSNAVVFALEDPLSAGEALLRERRFHRLQPLGRSFHKLKA